MKNLFILILFIVSYLGLANPIQVTGRIDKIIIDNIHGGEEIEYFLVDGPKEYKLKITNRQVLKDVNGAAVGTVKGNLDNNEITVTYFDLLEKALIAEARGGRILHVIADFNDGNKASDTVTKQDLYKMFYGNQPSSFVNFIKRASYGKIKFENNGMVDFKGPIKLPFPRTCNFYGIHRAADKILVEQGVDLSKYDHRAYVVDSACGWAGVATIGGKVSIYKDNYSKSSYLYAHELGHNFGLGHNNLPGRTYGDHSGVMGSPWRLIGYNAPHVWHMGWLNEITEAVVEVSHGKYELKPLGKEWKKGDIPQVLKIKDESKDAGNYYITLSYRQKFEGSLEKEFGMKDEYIGLNVHDLTTSPRLQKVLKTPGQSFKFEKVTVKLVSMSSDKIVVDISSDDEPPKPECNGDKLQLDWQDRYAILRKEGSIDYLKGTIRNLEKNCTMSVSLKNRKIKYFKQEIAPANFQLDGGSAKAFKIKATYTQNRGGKRFRMRLLVNEKKLGKKYTIRVK
jgi:hypothetical protein